MRGPSRSRDEDADAPTGSSLHDLESPLRRAMRRADLEDILDAEGFEDLRGLGHDRQIRVAPHEDRDARARFRHHVPLPGERRLTASRAMSERWCSPSQRIFETAA